MENRDSFFDFLDATAGQVEIRPPEQVRRAHLAAMEAEALKLRRARRRNLNRGGLALLFVLLVVTLAMLWQNYPQRSDQVTISEAVVGQKPATQAFGNKPTVAADEQAEALSKSDGNVEAANNRVMRASISAKAAPVSDGAISTQPATPKKAEGRWVTPHGGTIRVWEPRVSGMVPEIPSLVTNLVERTVPAMAIPKFADTVPMLRDARKAPALWFPGFSAGLHYTPEFMFNALDQTDKLVHNAGLEILWTKAPFSIRSGVSVSVATGVTELAYSYNENLGVKQQLDSVLFVWDAQGRKIVPTWFFSDQTVFDTAVGLQTKAIRKRYTYLQIPLILGYDFAATKRLSFGLRAGPVLQILIDTKQLDADPGTDNNRVISINQITPGRLSTHWQGLVGLNASFYLTRRLNIEFEPHVKYYFNSVYEKTTAIQKPWSVELRTALMIKL